MPGFAVGCPQRLAVRQGDSTGPHPTSILGMALGPTGAYLAILTRHDLQIWSGGQHQLLLGWAATDDVAGLDEDEDVYVKPGVVWHRGGREVCVLGLDGAVAFFEATPLEDYPLVEGIEPPEWVDVHPAGGGGGVGADSDHHHHGSGGGSSSGDSHAHAAPSDAPHAVEVTFLSRLNLGASEQAQQQQQQQQQQRATCLSAGLWGQHLLLGRDQEPVLMDVSWSGAVQHEYQLAPSSAAPGMPPTILLQACYSDVCHLLAAVLSDGRAVVSNVPSASFSVQSVPLPPGVQPQGPDILGIAETVAFSPMDALLAVGYDDGSVAVFRVASSNTYPHSPSHRHQRHTHATTESSASLSESAAGMSTSGPSLARHLHGQAHGGMESGKGAHKGQGRQHPSGDAHDIELVLFRRLSLASLGFEMRHVGAVMAMDFSPDGGSLAVAHAWSSLNVWDTAQWCRPMTTFPRAPETPDTPVLAAVPSLLWAHRGYRLLVAHNEVKDDEASASILRYEMLKWARSAPLADTPLCLQGVSTVALLEQRPWNPRLPSWARITLPPAYATSGNTPINLVALSPSGQHLALAGQRGLALYSRATRKWRLFGNVQQERELQVAALTWWGEDAIVVVARHRTSFSLRIYPRSHLDNASLLHDPLPLPPGTRPLFLECVKERDGGTVFRHSQRSQGRVPASGRRVSSSSDAATGAGEGGGSGGGGGGGHPPQQPAMGNVYWAESAVLMVGDASFLLFYRVARDHSPTGVSVSLMYDLPLPLYGSVPPAADNGGHADAAEAAARPAGEGGRVGIPVSGLGPGETPKRVVLLPGVRPRTVAILSSNDTLYRVEARTGQTSMVAGNVAGFWELCLPTADARMCPCYVLYCGANGFSLWLPSLREDKALELTWEACHSPFLDPTFNPDVEGALMGVHGPTSSLIFLTQTCMQPPNAPGGVVVPPRFEVGLQRRPIYQVAFRFLLFLQSMLSASSPPAAAPAIASGGSGGGGGGIVASLLGVGKVQEPNPPPPPPPSSSSLAAGARVEDEGAQAVAAVVGGIFDELYSQPETRIQLADALDFLVRSCIEAVASVHGRLKKKQSKEGEESYFTSLATSTEQVRAALQLCRRGGGLSLLYEVIVRVARKVEPSRLKHLFPLPAALDGQYGGGDTPVTLFEKCLASRKLHTALLYLPLIDPPATAPPFLADGPAAASPLSSSASRRARLAAARQEYEDLRLVHRLALRLLWECLRRGKREWRMLKQLWRFIEKREEAFAVRQEEARALGAGVKDGFGLGGPEGGGSTGGGSSGAAPGTGAGGGRPILGFLYRYTVGTLLSGADDAPSGAGGGQEGEGGRGPSASSAAQVGKAAGAGAAAPSFLSHLPTGGGGRGHTGTWNYTLAAEAEIQEEEIPGGSGAAAAAAAAGGASLDGSLLAGFDLLRHARSGREVVTLFASMCLATLRLREMVEALLLLGSNDPQRIPYPSLQPWVATGGGSSNPKRWQHHSSASTPWPWARFGDTAVEVVLDSFLAIREQFPATASASAAAAGAFSAATAGRASASSTRRKGECSAEERLAVLGRVCVELRDYECLLALGTFLRDERAVAAALRRGKVWPREYRDMFLDDRMEAAGPQVKAFVDRCTAVAVVPPTVQAAGGGKDDGVGR